MLDAGVSGTLAIEIDMNLFASRLRLILRLRFPYAFEIA